MRTFQSQSQPAPRGASSSLHSLSSTAMSPLSTASITLAALLILTIPVCKTLFNSSLWFLFQASDVLGELCVLMLVQKSKELKVRENSKRVSTTYDFPLKWFDWIHTDIKPNDKFGPGGIQSRGYFLYRPRNGRRSLEYE
uniref:Neuromedin U C-terminal domain-containing protein n=1 Tax=Seriola dumerili TaxID=41447 RepID=A0A3B4VLC0_SERDU